MAQSLPQVTPLSQCEENLNWGLFINDIICFTDLNREEYIVLYSMQVVKTNDVIHKQFRPVYDFLALYLSGEENCFP